MPFERLADATAHTRIGLGLAAIGRPGYITLGRDVDLPAVRTVEAMREHVHGVLDAAYAVGVRYVDAARSYGRAEEFLADWLAARPEVGDLVVGSKWGYTYIADWRVDASPHEVKDHRVAAFERQVAESRGLLGSHLDLYQIHSVTPDSPALTDRVLHERLAALAAEGVTVGLSTSGPDQAAAVRSALAVEVGGVPLFGSFQATYNLLEPSVGPALAEAHEAGHAVVVKEAVANGRLAREGHRPVLDAVAREIGATPDAVALAAVLRAPWVDIVLSGAATTSDIRSNTTATAVRLDADQLERLGTLAQPAPVYWRERSALPWT